ncbi:hypothetical protein AHF37_10005, partial [Paragonimus kellicotti]
MTGTDKHSPGCLPAFVCCVINCGCVNRSSCSTLFWGLYKIRTWLLYLARRNVLEGRLFTSRDLSTGIMFPSMSISEEQKREVADMKWQTYQGAHLVRSSDKHLTSDDFDVAEQKSNRAAEPVCCPHCSRQFARPWHLKLH